MVRQAPVIMCNGSAHSSGCVGNGSNAMAVFRLLFNSPHLSPTLQSTYDFRQLYGRQLYIERTFRNKTYSVDITAPLAFEAVWMLARALKVTHGTNIVP